MRRARPRPPPPGGLKSGTARRSLEGEAALAWICLIVAGLLEVVWAYLMKQSAGFTRLWPSVGAIAFMIASFGLLACAMRSLPLGTSYMVWTGIGAVGAFLVGVLALGEAAGALRVAAAVLIVSGLVLMKLSSAE